ncbi:MAG: inositol monophosphatase [Candidatus Diapherotrites archaeon]|uniref:inositol-phosphate phosphatase n=2 Tax=Candidatus Iainarchaeum sp. TaxID=3101447 RepID=A0A8T4LA48_9ARCH|nr:inositol monophosphatase [Candidatus Diapherotrites archaeon]
MKERDAAMRAAQEAGKKLMGAWKQQKETAATKEGGSLQLVMDKLCEEGILGLLKKEFPDYNTLSEECGLEEKGSDCTWIVDPLDGTHNYFFSIPMFGVAIALQEGEAITLGVIHLPYFDQTLWAEKGKGAFLNDRPIRVSDTDDLSKAMMLYDSAFYRKRHEMLDYFTMLMNSVFGTRILGSASIEFAMVARGKADFFVGHSTLPWDIAAGALIVEEAGGKVTDFQGHPWSPQSKNFVASNGKLHPKIMQIIGNYFK